MSGACMDIPFCGNITRLKELILQMGKIEIVLRFHVGNDNFSDYVASCSCLIKKSFTYNLLKLGTYEKPYLKKKEIEI